MAVVNLVSASNTPTIDSISQQTGRITKKSEPGQPNSNLGNGISGYSALPQGSTEVIVIPGGDKVPLYRGVDGGSYVYSAGTPPIGATHIVIVGFVNP